VTGEPSRTVLVLGATGKTGRQVVRHLRARGASVVAASRHPDVVPAAEAVAFDWYDPRSWSAVLESRRFDATYLVPPVRDPEPATVMLPFLRAAREAGVRRAVLLGAKPVPAGGPGIGRVAARLPELLPEWAVLRPSWFMQDFLGEHYLARMLGTRGALLTTSPGGRLAFIDTADVAAVATEALLRPEPPNTELILTGPEALTYTDVAAILSRVAGSDVRARTVDAPELVSELAATMPRALASLLVAADEALGRGGSDEVSDTVEQTTGHRPRTFEEFALAAWADGTLRIGREDDAGDPAPLDRSRST
jgi:uncharacterized protein YbjT (DUF2867 family)